MRAWIDRRFDEPSIDGEVIKLSYSNSIKKYKRMIVCQLHIDVEKWKVRMEVEEVPYGKGRKEYSFTAHVVGLQNALEWGEDALDKIYDMLEERSKKVRQRTGLKDMRGEAICVGDIVYGATNRDNMGRKWFHDAVIIREGGKFLAKVTETGFSIPIFDKSLEFICVIGNVNDCPELAISDEEIQD